MNAPVTNAESIVNTPSAAESSYHLEQVSDAELLTNTRRLVGRDKRKYGAPRKKPPAESTTSELPRAVASSANSEPEAPAVPPEEPRPQASPSKKHAQLPRQRRQRVASSRSAEQSKKRTQLPRQRVESPHRS